MDIVPIIVGIVSNATSENKDAFNYPGSTEQGPFWR